MSIRTDLAAEAAFSADGKISASENCRNGITKQVRQGRTCEITEITIETDEAGKAIGKGKGRYITIEASDPYAEFTDQADDIADELRKLCGCDNNVLIIGLGNSGITPDALGPQTVSGIIATRHLRNELPKGHFLSGLHSVSALATGVLGQTGIEVAEITRAVCDRTSPECVIVIDALACADTARLGTTVQLTDTGISPGSGVQNSRKELSRHTLGVPVVAVGVPTVIDMHTIYENMSGAAPAKTLPNMMVTPRDIDRIIDRTAKLLSHALNRAFQPDLSHEDIETLGK